MKLYYSKGACSLACRIIINELGLSCEFEAVNLANKKTAEGKDYFKINPKGSVPALLTDDDEVLTENAVILQYLADTGKNEKLLPLVGNFKRYRVLEWVNYVSTELHKAFGPLFHSIYPEEIKDKVVIPFIKSRLGYINKHLEKSRFLNGDTFILADAYLFVILTWALLFRFDLEEWPYLSRYFSELQKRKSIQQSLEQEGIHLKTHDKA